MAPMLRESGNAANEVIARQARHKSMIHIPVVMNPVLPERQISTIAMQITTVTSMYAMREAGSNAIGCPLG